MDKKDGVAQFNSFLQRHFMQLESSAIPEHFWLSLYKKLEGQIFDAGDTFSIYHIDYSDSLGGTVNGQPLYKVLISKEHGVDCQNGFEIYLIDHAWTYEANKATKNLEEVPGLLNRMCKLMGIATDQPDSVKIGKVCHEMWRYNQTYTIASENVVDHTPVWYIMDEFGSALQHSDVPNCRMVPFYNLLDNTIYSLLFPIKDIRTGDEVTRDYLEGPFGKDEISRKALLLPWQPNNLLNINFSHKNQSSEYFSTGRIAETLPSDVLEFDTHGRNLGILNVYSDYQFVVTHLKNPNFRIVDSMEEADVLWLTQHFKKYKEFREESPHKFINQFPCENVLTVKDLFCIVCRRKKRGNLSDELSANPPWLPVTYNLKTELLEFCSYFQHRQEAELNNHWICKPWNLARGLDTCITDNLNRILRLPLTGPKIAQKYIENPVLFNRPEIGNVKFDIRYVILLKSVKPLVTYVFTNFFLRFANKPFGLTELDDYEKHFTVMNYNAETPLNKMLCHEFKEEFEKQNPAHKWTDVERNILECLKEMFEAAVMEDPPCGIGHNVQSRALYAVDLMLSWTPVSTMQPMLLEVNWVPDCQRACQYYPDFYDDIFSLLFKDVENQSKFYKL